MVSVADKKSIASDERGGPLVEESLLLGLAVVTVSIVIGVILQATGWAQGIVDALFQLLEDSWTSFTQLFTLP
jgi:ABC-type microcin C transport system permease subunit YejE